MSHIYLFFSKFCVAFERFLAVCLHFSWTGRSTTVSFSSMLKLVAVKIRALRCIPFYALDVKYFHDSKWRLCQIRFPFSFIIEENSQLNGVK